MNKSAYLLVFFITIWISKNIHSDEFNIAVAEFPLMCQQEKIFDAGHGVVCDLIIEALKAENISVNLHFYPLARSIRTILTGQETFTYSNLDFFRQLHVDINDLGYSPLMQHLSFYYYYKPNHSEYFLINKLHDFHGHRIGVHRGSPTLNKLKQAGAIISQYDRPRSAFSMLKANRIDFMEVTNENAYYAFTHSLKSEKEDFAKLTDVYASLEMGIVYLKSNNEANRLMKHFEKGLKIIRKNGTFKKIYQQYLGDMEPVTNQESSP